MATLRIAGVSGRSHHFTASHDALVAGTEEVPLGMISAVQQ